MTEAESYNYEDLNDSTGTPNSTDVPKKSVCDRYGKKTCEAIFALAVIFLMIAICWWMFQICSQGETEDQDEQSPMCQMLGDVGKVLGDFAGAIATALNNLGWLLAIGSLYAVYKVLDLFGLDATRVKEKEAELTETRDASKIPDDNNPDVDDGELDVDGGQQPKKDDHEEEDL